MYTASDIHIKIEQEIQIIGGVQYEGLLPEYLDLQFNTQLMKYVKHRYTQSYDPKSYSHNLKRLSDLRTLMGSKPITTGSNDDYGSIPVWSTDQLFNDNDDIILPVSVQVKIKNGLSVPTGILAGDHLFDTYDDYTKHAFKRKVYAKRPFVYIEGQRLFVLKYGFEVEKIHTNYIEFPNEINISNNSGTNLPDYVVDEVIQLTVSHIRSLINPERYQLDMMEEQKNE